MHDPEFELHGNKADFFMNPQYVYGFNHLH
jgi:hypothetical protein